MNYNLYFNNKKSNNNQVLAYFFIVLGLFKTLVKGMPIILSKNILGLIFGLPTNFSTLSDDSILEWSAQARKTFFIPDVPIQKKPTHTSLTTEGKVLFNLISRCILTRINSREMLTDLVLALMHMVDAEIPIDVPDLLIGIIINPNLKSRSTPLPFANLLQKIFTHHALNLEGDEEFEHLHIFNDSTISAFGVIRGEDGNWITKPHANSPSTSAAPDIIQTLIVISTQLTALSTQMEAGFSRMFSLLEVPPSQPP